MPFLFDPAFMLLLPALVLVLYAQFKVTRAFNRYAQVRAARGIAAVQMARHLLRHCGVYDVKIKQVDGLRADHYDPRTKTLRLSMQVYGSTSVAALGVAAHECGHALQHRDGYALLALRSAMIPAAQIGTSAAGFLFLAGLLLSTPVLMDIGILLFLGYLLFALVTLAVEFNASSRAVRLLQSEGFVLPQEVEGVRAVLSAAALTYVAASAMVILQLARLIVIRRR